jgi:hypothetical protein
MPGTAGIPILESRLCARSQSMIEESIGTGLPELAAFRCREQLVPVFAERVQKMMVGVAAGGSTGPCHVRVRGTAEETIARRPAKVVRARSAFVLLPVSPRRGLTWLEVFYIHLVGYFL